MAKREKIEEDEAVINSLLWLSLICFSVNTNGFSAALSCFLLHIWFDCSTEWEANKEESLRVVEQKGERVSDRRLKSASMAVAEAEGKAVGSTALLATGEGERLRCKQFLLSSSQLSLGPSVIVSETKEAELNSNDLPLQLLLLLLLIEATKQGWASDDDEGSDGNDGNDRNDSNDRNDGNDGNDDEHLSPALQVSDSAAGESDKD